MVTERTRIITTGHPTHCLRREDTTRRTGIILVTHGDHGSMTGEEEEWEVQEGTINDLTPVVQT